MILPPRCAPRLRSSSASMPRRLVRGKLFARPASYLRERALPQLYRIADAGLRDLEHGLGDDFGERIGPVGQLQNAQAILIGGDDRRNVLGQECRLLQQAVNRHWRTLQSPGRVWAGAKAFPVAAGRPAMANK